MNVDSKAWTILHNTFWSSKGWKDEKDRRISDEDFVYAKSKGIMFDPVVRSHSQTTELLASQVSKLSLRTVANAFLASLSTRRLDWRSVFGSYVVFQHFRNHAAPDFNTQCDYCGLYCFEEIETEDVNVLNFERLKWGGVRHLDPEYAVLDLSLFLNSETPSPTALDIQIFNAILQKIDAAPPGTTSSKLQKHFSDVLKSNKAERETLLGLLGYCGILATPQFPGFSEKFIPFQQRTLPSRRFVDLAFPFCWWTQADGINQSKVQEFFGHLL